ncbi:hypothetical protein Moror_4160 [Moniliophthora roreri MCA 2997]|uniref:Uncharacterized protein n=1 Tax=Moniliophthora roreri (strain MCA 2997) TaxID=1381753 RepID=V2XD10_MONRO|nr:hypothetical protein Moror_4160 [Moniliophthora roreri MCA 2997]
MLAHVRQNHFENLMKAFTGSSGPDMIQWRRRYQMHYALVHAECYTIPAPGKSIMLRLAHICRSRYDQSTTLALDMGASVLGRHSVVDVTVERP